MTAQLRPGGNSRPALRPVPAEPKPALPHDVEAEQATLGAMLMSPDALAYGLQHLRQHQFHLQASRLVFGAIRETNAAGYGVDPITVASTLRHHGLLEQVPPVQLLALVTQCPSAANIRAYAAPVVETWRLRQLGRLGDWLAKQAMAPEATAGELMQFVRTQLDAIERGEK